MRPNEYIGDLADDCLPNDVVDAPDVPLLRMVDSNSPTMDDFRSWHAETGKIRPMAPKYMSFGVSFFNSNKPLFEVKELTKLPNLKKMTHLATVKVGPANGSVLHDDPTRKGHYCMFLKESFNLSESILKVDML